MVCSPEVQFEFPIHCSTKYYLYLSKRKMIGLTLPEKYFIFDLNIKFMHNLIKIFNF